MTAFIIGCGESAEGWFNHPHDVSIGVQDCKRWGKDVDQLLLIDSKIGFKNEPERLEIIKNSNPGKVYTHGPTWNDWFPNAEHLRLTRFNKYLKKGHVYCSKSSPFVGISLAFNMGATDIILFGVDMKSHKLFHPGTRTFDYEMRQIEKLCRMMADQGTSVWVSSEKSALSKFLNVWTDINKMILE